MYLVCRLLLEKKKRTLRSSSCPRWMLRARTTASSAHQRSAVTRSRSCACARPSPGWPRSILRFPGSGASSLSLFWPGPPRSPTLFPYTTLFRSLKTIADHLGLTPGTVSAALNNSPAARSIPEHTKNRIIEAAQALNYRPNFFARTLRLKRTYTIGVIAEEIGDAYGSMVISGIEEYLRKNDYFFLTVIHRHDPKLLQTYAQMLLTRGVEGFITTDTSLTEKLALPTVAVAGHQRVDGLTNIILDNTHAARLALEHLRALGHADIAFIKGQTVSADSAVRGSENREDASELDSRLRPDLTIQLEGFDSTPGIGYTFCKQLLARKHPFTALFAYNDIAAIGSIWAIREAGLRVPEEDRKSVV